VGGAGDGLADGSVGSGAELVGGPLLGGLVLADGLALLVAAGLEAGALVDPLVEVVGGSLVGTLVVGAGDSGVGASSESSPPVSVVVRVVRPAAPEIGSPESNS